MFGGPAGYQAVSYASYPPQQQQSNILHGPPGLMDPRPQPPTPTSAASPANALHSTSSSPLQQQFLTPPAPHGLSSLAAAVDHSPSSASASSSHSHYRDDNEGGHHFHLGRSRSRSPGRTPASHHQISQKRKEAHRIEYNKHMKTFWSKQKELIERTDYKRLKHDLPLARIKKIMKSDDEVRMISAEVPILFSKACELFILDLTMRAWAHTADTNRRTLQRSDVADAISEGEGMDFLVDIVPREDDVIASGIGGGGQAVSSGSVDKRESGGGGGSDGRGRREEVLPGVSEDAGMTTEGLLKLMEREMNGGERRPEQQPQQQQPPAQPLPAMQPMGVVAGVPSVPLPSMPMMPMSMSAMPAMPVTAMPAPSHPPAPTGAPQ